MKSLHGVLLAVLQSGIRLLGTFRATPEGERLGPSISFPGVLTFVYETLYSFSSMSPANFLITLHFWLLFCQDFLNPLFLHSYVCDVFFYPYSICLSFLNIIFLELGEPPCSNYSSVSMAMASQPGSRAIPLGFKSFWRKKLSPMALHPAFLSQVRLHFENFLVKLLGSKKTIQVYATNQ